MSGITLEAIERAEVETARLMQELDITNADHIALWLEANDDTSTGYRACRIADALEALLAVKLKDANEALGWAMAEIDGLTCYDADDQRQNAYDRANAVSADIWAIVGGQLHKP